MTPLEIRKAKAHETAERAKTSPAARDLIRDVANQCLEIAARNQSGRTHPEDQAHDRACREIVVLIRMQFNLKGERE